jgi:hypothetical protein
MQPFCGERGPSHRLVGFLAMTVLVGMAQGVGAEPRLPPHVRRDVEQIRQVLERNFQATSEENLSALMMTISPSLPGRAQFQAESKKLKVQLLSPH